MEPVEGAIERRITEIQQHRERAIGQLHVLDQLAVAHLRPAGGGSPKRETQVSQLVQTGVFRAGDRIAVLECGPQKRPIRERHTGGTDGQYRSQNDQRATTCLTTSHTASFLKPKCLQQTVMSSTRARLPIEPSNVNFVTPVSYLFQI